jgi:transcription elongation factor GreA
MNDQKFYLSKEGFQKFEQELKRLMVLKQKKIHSGAPTALHSEELDIEFVSFKEELDLLENRIEEIEYILKNAILIEPPKGAEREKINLGAKIEVEVNGHTDQFILVGTLEANPEEGKISNESLLGRALFGKKIGEQVVLENGPVYTIKKITY